jgi:hypothetical protein
LDVEISNFLNGIPAVLGIILRVKTTVKEWCMRGVKLSFQSLHPVAFIDEPAIVPSLCLWNQTPLKLRHTRRVLLVGTHVDPGDATEVCALIGRDLQLVLEVAGGRLVRHVNAVAVHIELPTMVSTTQASLLVPAKVETSSTVGAQILGECGDTVRVTPCQQIFAKKPHPLGLTVRL